MVKRDVRRRTADIALGQITAIREHHPNRGEDSGYGVMPDAAATTATAWPQLMEALQTGVGNNGTSLLSFITYTDDPNSSASKRTMEERFSDE